MTRRRKVLWLLAGLFGLAAASLAGPYVYWGVVGLRGGEPFYRGLPLSYWRGAVLRHREWKVHPPVWVQYCPDAVLKLLGVGAPAAIEAGIPEALPVVLRLIADDDGRVSAAGVDALQQTPILPGMAMLPLLREALESPDDAVCYHVAQKLEDSVELDAILAAYVRLLARASPDTRLNGIRALRRLGPRARATFPHLLRLFQKDDNWSVRVEAKWTLHRIDSEAADAARVW